MRSEHKGEMEGQRLLISVPLEMLWWEFSPWKSESGNAALPSENGFGAGYCLHAALLSCPPPNQRRPLYHFAQAPYPLLLLDLAVSFRGSEEWKGSEGLGSPCPGGYLSSLLPGCGSSGLPCLPSVSPAPGTQLLESLGT